MLNQKKLNIMIINNLFDDVFKYTRNFETLNDSKWETVFGPNALTNETENGFELMIAIPGLTKDSVSVELDSAKNQIIIENNEDTDFVSKFKRVYKIPTSINLDTIEVSVDAGILKVDMQRKAEASRKKLL
jgi:HSP20 family protein